MKFPVGDVIELVGPQCTAGVGGVEFLGYALRLVYEMAGVLEGAGRHQAHICTISAQRIDLILTLVIRHHDDRRVAQRITDHRQTNTGVARCAFDNCAAGAQQALRFGVAHDAERGTVFY